MADWYQAHTGHHGELDHAAESAIFGRWAHIANGLEGNGAVDRAALEIARGQYLEWRLSRLIKPACLTVLSLNPRRLCL